MNGRNTPAGSHDEPAGCRVPRVTSFARSIEHCVEAGVGASDSASRSTRFVNIVGGNHTGSDDVRGRAFAGRVAGRNIIAVVGTLDLCRGPGSVPSRGDLRQIRASVAAPTAAMSGWRGEPQAVE